MLNIVHVQGQKQSEETKQKISSSKRKYGTLPLSHRFSISQGKSGTQHSDETKRKIGLAVSTTKRKLRKERLAQRAAIAAEEATADLRHKKVFASQSNTTTSEEDYDDDNDNDGYDSYDDEDNLEEEEELVLDMLELEKTVIELTSLRTQLSAWMDAYEKSTF